MTYTKITIDIGSTHEISRRTHRRIGGAAKFGTQTGWAWGDGRGMVVSGTWDFSKGHDSPQLVRRLQEIKADFGVAHVYVTAPNAGRGDFGLKGLCKRLDLPCEAIRDSDLRKFWAGNGRASKDSPNPATILSISSRKGS